MVGDGNGNPVRACVKGGTASIEKKKASPPRDTNHKIATGMVAANDHEQMSSEGANTMADDGNGNLVRACVKGGVQSIEKEKESPARDANYKMASGDAAANDHQQISYENGKLKERCLMECREPAKSFAPLEFSSLER